jgi:hypothetical protein
MSIIQRTVTVARPFPPEAAGTYAILSEAEYTAKYVVS